jgi:hypothetical protein
MASLRDENTASSPSAQYSLTLRVEIDHLPGMLGKVASAIGEAGGTIGAVDLVAVLPPPTPHTIRDITVETGDAADWPRLTEAVNSVPGARVLDTTDRTFVLHIGGKIEVANKHTVKNRDDLSMAYTRVWRGCARPSATIPTRPSSTRSSATRWRSCPTARPCWAWATSARGPPCR